MVIVGGGFAGLAAARRLKSAPVEVTVIDRHNYHLFQPLLYQVATAGLSPSDIAWPIRSILSGQQNARVVLGEVIGINSEQRRVILHQGEIPYDYLIVASGARHSYFGNPNWEQFAPGLKSVDDATDIRKRILLAFERAELEDDPDQRRALLTFLIVGAGPTGVELAGAVAELSRKALASDFRRIDPTVAKIILVQADDRVLPVFPAKLSRYAQAALEKLDIEVRLNSRVTFCDTDGAHVGAEVIPAATIIWAAGVAASPVGEWLNLETDPAGRVPVNEHLLAGGHDNIFVVGDAAGISTADGTPVPGIAPAAKQAGTYAADYITAQLQGRAPPGFSYRHYGNLATIGRTLAVIEMGKLRLKGWLAWWIWGLAHIYFLISVRNRILVAWQWAWSYLTFQRGARLITGKLQ